MEFQPDYAQYFDDGSGSITCTVVIQPMQDTIGTNEFRNLPEYGLIYPDVGQVTLIDQNGVQLTAPIRAGPGSKLSYSFSSLPAGTYQLSAYLFYKHPTEDTEPRLFSWLYERVEEVPSVMVTVGDGAITVRDLFLKPFAPACSSPEP